MNHRSRKRTYIIWILVLLLAAAGAGGGYYFYQNHHTGQQADQVLDAMYDLVPHLGDETGASTGPGRDPLAAMSIDGMDIVGCLSIPALEITAPVAAKGVEAMNFATWYDGSPVTGLFRITGGREDLFLNLASLKPGDRVTFTDMDGVQYRYMVTTQYHLKNWDEGDNDLMLSYETDDKTHFVVGCTLDYGE